MADVFDEGISRISVALRSIVRLLKKASLLQTPHAKGKIPRSIA
jgi:hypothetical protein